MKQLLVSFVLLLSIVSSCGSNSRPVGEKGDTLHLQYAQQLTMVKYKGYTEVSLADPWHKGKILHRYLLIPRGREGECVLKKINTSDGTVVRIPVTRSVLFTTVHCSLLADLGVKSAVKGVCDLQYILLPWVEKNGKPAPGIVDCGNSMNADIEKIIDLRPQAILLSPFENSGGYGKLDEIHIPVIECADYMESTPLGRAEWMKFYGLLFGREQQADSLFLQVCKQYHQFQAQARHMRTHPKVITELKTGAVWYVPGGASYVGQMIADAGARYAFASDKSEGSLSLTFEKVLDEAGDADIWLYKYNDHPCNLKELLSGYTGYQQMKAFQDKQVYGADCARVPFYEESGFHPERVLRDMMIIFHPEIKMGKLRYYKRLD
jgi:iron complex transport system substrate-binding protein